MTLAERIAQLEKLLDSGVQSSTVSDRSLSVQYDLEAIRRHLRELKQQAGVSTRPLIATVDLRRA